MVGSRTLAALVGLLGSLTDEQERQTKRCDRCGFRTTEESYDYCPRDGSRLVETGDDY